MLKKGLMCLCLLILPGCGQGPGAPVVETTIQLNIVTPGTGSGILTIHNAGGSTWTKDFDVAGPVEVTDYAYSGSTASFTVTYTDPLPHTINYILGPKVKQEGGARPLTVIGVVCNPDHTSAAVTFE